MTKKTTRLVSPVVMIYAESPICTMTALALSDFFDLIYFIPSHTKLTLDRIVGLVVLPSGS
jgi:hypothetical protein